MNGSIVKNKGKKGVTWTARVEYPRGGDGCRRWKRDTFGTKNEAQDALVRMLAEAQRQMDCGYVDPGKLTVGEYLDQYLETVGPTLKPGSVITLQYNLARWKPIVGHILLAKLTRMDVQKGVNTLPSHLAPITRACTFQALRQALRQAVGWDMLIRTPTAGVKPPAAPQREMKIWTSDEAERFLEKAKAKTRYYPIFVLGLKTGMRRGELLGVKWEDVDLSQGFITVRRSLYWMPPAPPIFQDPKTAGSRRKIPLDRGTVEMLKAHRKHQLEERLAAGPAWEDWGLIFCTEENGRPIYGPNLVKQLKVSAREAKVPAIRFHDLRHTHATFLLQAGVSVKVVAERLGHTTVRITLDTYSHILPDMQEAAVKALEGMFLC